MDGSVNAPNCRITTWGKWEEIDREKIECPPCNKFFDGSTGIRGIDAYVSSALQFCRCWIMMFRRRNQSPFTSWPNFILRMLKRSWFRRSHNTYSFCRYTSPCYPPNSERIPAPRPCCGCRGILGEPLRVDHKCFYIAKTFCL